MAKQTIESMLHTSLNLEGERYTDDPNDSGGATKWGITQKALSAYLQRQATKDEVRALTHDMAYAILYREYVIDPGFDLIVDLDSDIAAELVDTGINMGPAVATTFLQTCLNALNRQAKDYRDIPVDGKCGAYTAQALKSFLYRNPGIGKTVMLRALNCEQGHRYITLAQQRSKDESFLNGWLANRVVI